MMQYKSIKTGEEYTFTDQRHMRYAILLDYWWWVKSWKHNDRIALMVHGKVYDVTIPFVVVDQDKVTWVGQLTDDAKELAELCGIEHRDFSLEEMREIWMLGE